MSEEETLAKFRENYNGYHFAKMHRGVQPLAAHTLPKRFRSYWFETGTPDYLGRAVEDAPYNLEDLAPRG